MRKEKYNFIWLLVLVIIFSCSCNNKKDTLSASTDNHSLLENEPIIYDTVSNKIRLNLDWFDEPYKQDTGKYELIAQNVLGHYISQKFNRSDSIFYAHYLNYRYKRYFHFWSIIEYYEFALQTGNTTGIRDMSIYNWIFDKLDEKINKCFFVEIDDTSRVLVTRSIDYPEDDEASIILFSKDGVFQEIPSMESRVDEIQKFENRSNKIYVQLYHIIKFPECPYYYENVYFAYNPDSLKFIKEGLADEELDSINKKMKKVGWPLIDKYRTPLPDTSF